MTAAEVRRSFLSFFERHGHRVVSSSSLVPSDDPTLLFTNAGMNQFKDVFLGRERRGYVRAASVQKCMRVSGKHNDLDNVGPSVQHHTFFEMLGNFSFGDYFKKEAIELAWSLLTSWKLPPERLVATVFKGEAGIPQDEEACTHWRRFLPADRIVPLGLTDNFWAMGDTGPCGRCSEVHYFRGDDVACAAPVCLGPACTCERFVEIWNNVFMEFDRQPDGTLTPLPAPSIDTGMGLERIAAVLQGTLSNYDTDLFTPLIGAIEQAAGVRYGDGERSDISIRVIADHVRATTFLVADGVVPSNEWRGYVLRKIMRRALRHGNHLGLTQPFLHQLVDVVVREMGEVYPELRRERDAILRAVENEEERFDAVLNAGLPRLEEVLDRAAAVGRVVAGEEIFRLYDSLGLPVDFIEDLAGERRLTVDREGFERAMDAQRERARAASAFGAHGAAGATGTAQLGTQEFRFSSDEAKSLLQSAPDIFEGYATTRVSGVRILALFDRDRRQKAVLQEPEAGYVVLERTPFYLEAGGQVSDTGRISSEAGRGEARVEGMVRLRPGVVRAHGVQVLTGTLGDRDLVTAEVDVEARDATRRNHTATHLLHAALRQVLGPHVKQAGSLVAPDRLRFDFVQFAPLSPSEVERIEALVNEQVVRNTPLLTEVRATREAIAAGAVALFGEKYGERARVVSIPDFSVELCGGTHCRATGEIGFFVIVSEAGVAAGVRRIEALTGAGAVRHYQQYRAMSDALLGTLNVPSNQAAAAIERIQSENKRLARELSEAKVKAAMGGVTGPVDDVAVIDGVKLLVRRVEALDKAALRALADQLKATLRSGVVVLASASDGKVSIVVSVTPDLHGRLHAGQIVKQLAPIVGGGGGGRPDFAEAGGKDPSKIDELIARSRDLVQEMVRTS